MQQEIRKYGQNKTAGLPVVFIENSPTCAKNDQGQKQLPDLRAWLPDLMEKVRLTAIPCGQHCTIVSKPPQAAYPSEQ